MRLANLLLTAKAGICSREIVHVRVDVGETVICVPCHGVTFMGGERERKCRVEKLSLDTSWMS